jgi:MinD superfamily P-loop ATPase
LGRVEVGASGEVTVVTGMMNLGEASAVPTIRAALRKGLATRDECTVIDCPPGSGCAVMESVSAADYCLLVAEPTAFGLHNVQMVHELARLLHKPCGMVVNKASGAYPPLNAYCEANGLPVLAEFPYREAVAVLNAKGEVACQKDAETGRRFQALLKAVRGEAEACANC